MMMRIEGVRLFPGGDSERDVASVRPSRRSLLDGLGELIAHRPRVASDPSPFKLLRDPDRVRASPAARAGREVLVAVPDLAVLTAVERQLLVERLESVLRSGLRGSLRGERSERSG